MQMNVTFHRQARVKWNTDRSRIYEQGEVARLCEKKTKKTCMTYAGEAPLYNPFPPFRIIFEYSSFPRT